MTHAISCHSNPARIVAALAMLGLLSLADEAAAQKKAEGHFVVVYGADSADRPTATTVGAPDGRLIGIAGGAGVLFGGKTGVGGEIALLGHKGDERPGGYVSVGVSRHLLASQAPRALVPFVAVGYTTTLFEDGSGFYFGAGTNYWFGDGKALRVELRKVVASGKDYTSSNSFNHVRDAWLVRVGASFGRPK